MPQQKWQDSKLKEGRGLSDDFDFGHPSSANPFSFAWIFGTVKVALGVKYSVLGTAQFLAIICGPT